MTDDQLAEHDRKELEMIREIRRAGPFAPGPSAWEWTVVAVVALGAAVVEWLGGR